MAADICVALALLKRRLASNQPPTNGTMVAGRH
jgi:hypothetical protein